MVSENIHSPKAPTIPATRRWLFRTLEHRGRIQATQSRQFQVRPREFVQPSHGHAGRSLRPRPLFLCGMDEHWGPL